jgi:periplasmic protein TonB
MEISKILNADLLDIIFEGRNKEYGAYELRSSYASRLRVSIAVMGSLVLLFVAGFLFADTGKLEITKLPDVGDVKLVNLEEKIVEPLLPPPPPAQKPPDVMERRNVTIVVVPNEQVKPEDMPPPNEEFDHAKISLLNKDGVVDDRIITPSSNDAVAQGIIEQPKRINEDSVFITVSIESQYPGGVSQWARFLNKNLANNYPQEAADNGIQGRVVIQFIVDKDGNVSEVHAISGPRELHESAVKVIRKSGKWIPAEQNGRKVKSYKSQPIIFSLGEQ